MVIDAKIEQSLRFPAANPSIGSMGTTHTAKDSGDERRRSSDQRARPQRRELGPHAAPLTADPFREAYTLGVDTPQLPHLGLAERRPSAKERAQLLVTRIPLLEYEFVIESREILGELVHRH
jgi:hypothetical protein